MMSEYKNTEPLFGGDEDDFVIPADAPTLFSGPAAGRPFPFTIVDEKIVRRIDWRGHDICDVKSEKLLFDSLPEATAFIAGIEAATLAAKEAVGFHIIEPHAERKYFEA
jgi:hypothetical protein